MRRSTRAMALLLCFIIAVQTVPAAAPAAPDKDVSSAIVKIYTISNTPDYYNPWSMHGPRGSTGSGCIIEGRRILTNGHVVGDQTFIQVRRYGEARKYQARVLSVSHHSDLALLTVDDPSFFEGVEPLEFGGLPEAQQEVLVYGFPLGGDVLSITKGVVSRIEHRSYAHSSCGFLAGQIDAAINPGNSGGPVIVADRIVGVVMQAISQAENIGYMVPVPIVQHFLEDIRDREYDGFPSLGMLMQNMENPDLKRKYAVPKDETGMLVVKVVPGSPADGQIEGGDVLLSVAGHQVADDGTVEFRPKQRTSVSYYVQEKQIGEPIDVEVLRDGKLVKLNIPLTRSQDADRLVPLEQYDILPTYYIFGGIVFCPLTKNLLQAWGGNWYNNAPKDLVVLLSDNFVTEDRDEVVLALRVLAADVNEGYHGISNWAVDEVNGKKIRNIKELIAAIESDTAGPFVVLKDEQGKQIVLDREKARAAHQRILRTYRIRSDRSDDLKDL